ncbi:MAG: 50S ribosomal protein L18 [Thermoproteota archaeon]
MAKGPHYRLPFKRRRDGKTDYKARKAFLLSRRLRLVIRGSLKNMIAQIISAKPKGDEVLVSAHSRELTRDYGWKASRGNIPTAYLTGLLCGLKAEEKGIEKAVLDLGLNSPIKGGRIFAALKGVLDSGIKVPYNKEKIPDEARIEGQHIADYAEKLTANPEEYKARFSRYLKKKLPPEEIPEHFRKVKKNIIESGSGE